jgi:hypothetical protein
MTDTPSSTGTGDALDPPGGHSREALEDAAEKMNVDEGPDETVLDPPGGHDPEALKDAAEKMGLED